MYDDEDTIAVTSPSPLPFPLEPIKALLGGKDPKILSWVSSNFVRNLVLYIQIAPLDIQNLLCLFATLDFIVKAWLFC